jgi:hypothetical protein
MTEGERDEDAKADEDERAATPDPHAAVLASWGYPAFARGFPRHAELDTLVEAFANGDYLTVRTRAPKLATSPDIPASVKRAAELLRARVEPDKTARTFFALAAGLLLFLTLWWVTHDGPEHPAPAPAVVPPQVKLLK